jgi:hypothetical protein
MRVLSTLEAVGIFTAFFFLIVIVGCVVQFGPLSAAATHGLLCHPQVITMMEKLVE